MVEQKSRLLEYQQYLLLKGYKKTTVNRYISDLNLFYKVTKQPVTKDTLALYLERLRKTHKVSSVKRIQSVLNNFYKFINDINLTPMIREKQGSLYIQCLTDIQFEKLLAVASSTSTEALSDKQKELKSILLNRNLAIIILMGKYGLTLNEIVELNMSQINFYKCTISINNIEIVLQREDMNYLFYYYNMIPKLIQPLLHSTQPFFIAYDNVRMTYSWDYEHDIPKRLSKNAIQKFIRKEVQLAGVPKISGQNLRNMAIIKSLREGMSAEGVRVKYRLTTIHAVNRYKRYLKHMKN